MFSAHFDEFNNIDYSKFGYILEKGFSYLMSHYKKYDFAVLTAFRDGNTLDENRRLNKELLIALNMKEINPFMAIGHWRDADAKVVWKSETEDQSDYLVEDIIIAFRWNKIDMDKEEFKAAIVEVLLDTKVDSAIFCSEKKLGILHTNGEITRGKSKVSLASIASAISRLRNKADTPFYFDGLLSPVNNMGKPIFQLMGIDWVYIPD